MTYGSIYEAVADTYRTEHAWEEMLRAGEPASMNVAEEALERHADSGEVALRIRDFEDGGEEAHSFSELNRAANRAANYLTATMDRGERVGLMLPPRLELYAMIFGAIKTQRVFVPLDPKFGPDALSYRLSDAGATTLVTTPDHLGKVEPDEVPSLERTVVVDGGGGTVGDLPAVAYDEVRAASDAYEAIRMHPSEPYTIVYSSGTTGQPSQQPAVHATAVGIQAFLEFVVDLLPGDSYFAAASPAWSYGLTVGTLCPGLKGTNIGAYRGRFDLERWLETLELWDVTNAMVAPTALRQLRASDVDPGAYDVDLRVLVTAGETLDAATAEWVESALGTPPLDAYGLSEGGMLVCNYPFPDWEVRHGSMGRPIPGYDVRLCDPDESPEATREDPAPTEEMTFVDGPGAVGEITAYQSPSGPLEGLRAEGWQRMGDLAEVDEDGYWWYRGRADEVIISAGYRIGPEEIQATLVEHGAVAETGVVGVDHETRGNAVKAFVVPAAGHEPSEKLREELVEFARRELSKHEYPRELVFVDDLPRTPSDKIRRRELEEMHREGIGE